MAATARRDKKRGYLETAIGSLVGGVLGAIAGFVLGILYVEAFMPNAGLEAILPVFISTAAGIALGIGVGVWGALRLRNQLAAGITGLVSAFLGTVVAVFVLWAVEVALDELTGRKVSEWFAPAWAAAAAVLTAVGVRGAVARFRGSDWDEPPPPPEGP